ncbi:GCN5 family acetyltransferase [Methanocalculus chunghsingensis]|uniref:GCN5 family acetyltransferase n=1 Tax=Methanocalculus chunghsingensis TaxID=156457 RepID=A0A8J7W9I4_9EURY|nr:GNAT family N-acetyltransferase [Methanocalculus chunghsingensis]MBR1369968.1 GCN5 family acetyltransferase [Methanocalculus chunghsingensis]
MRLIVRELRREEFKDAEKIWIQYRGQKADPAVERIFGVFEDGILVSTARCTRHPDGLEMDCVFTPETHRGRGYARLTVEALLSSCGETPIYIHSTLPLISFYTSLGFSRIEEKQMPQTIRDRFLFCFGEMEGCNAIPMVRS